MRRPYDAGNVARLSHSARHVRLFLNLKVSKFFSASDKVELAFDRANSTIRVSRSNKGLSLHKNGKGYIVQAAKFAQANGLRTDRSFKGFEIKGDAVILKREIQF